MQTPSWLQSLGYGLLGGALYYYIHHVLAFQENQTSTIQLLLTTLCIGLGLIGSTSYFKAKAQKVGLWSLPLVLLVVILNIALTYAWINPSPTANFLASGLSIPIGIVWLFVLKHYATSSSIPVSPASPVAGFSIKEVFKPNLTKIAAALILMVAGVLFFYRLGYFDIWEDENLVINAAKGVSEEGWSYFDEGYSRARLHTLIIAGMFELFGDSEFIGRVPSAIFGILFVLLCFYVFARWYGLAWLALMIPLICLMNDRFLLLFRYMRMYALLIPLFLAGTYILYKTIEIFQRPPTPEMERKDNLQKWGFALLSVLFLVVLAHIHKLSMILLPVFGIYILYQVWLRRTKTQIRLLWVACGTLALLLILTFIAELEALKMFRQVANRIVEPHTPLTDYFEFVTNNGLPRNATIMFLVAGFGLLFSQVSKRLKSLLVINYLLIIIAIVSMVYLVGNTGRDYRYIAHIVPFVVCTLLLVIYHAGKATGKKTYPWGIITFFLISALHLQQDYTRNYIKHPWSPRYSEVYETLKANFKPGDALIVTNVKTYYLDAEALAGENYLKVSKKGDYTLDLFKDDIRTKGHGWVMWEFHKSHQWRPEVRQYIYKKFKPYHSANFDDLGVELFYFDETMVGQGQK